MALTPAAMTTLRKLGVELLVEPEAGAAAGFGDESYTAAGAAIAADRDDVFRRADLIVQVRAAAANPAGAEADLARVRDGQTLIGTADALIRTSSLVPWVERGVTLLALELMPRITRAQSMDVLSSMATIAGYRATILAASHSTQMFPLLMTAAGTLKPAKVFVIGAGVAGLQALATAKRLGARVFACDVRPAVKEQVESLGGTFVALPGGSAEGKGGYAREVGEDVLKQQQEALRTALADCDIVICTAAVPGKPAPKLVTSQAVAGMRSGAVIVDLGAESGGNCELTKPGETIHASGVTILGPLNIASDAPRAASEMFSNNVLAFLKILIKDGRLTLNPSDECVSGTLVCQAGETKLPAVRDAIGPVKAPQQSAPSGSGEAVEGDGYSLQRD
ncbi:MAG: NAD(P) transhydrogenase subunit alpha [Planctomyces sp.]|nr:NAD(P) transhydrogenase subunit alpha [Planctomyces sp.]